MPNFIRAKQSAADQAVIIADNAALNQTSSEFCLPKVTYTTIESDGVRKSRSCRIVPVVDMCRIQFSM